MDMAGASQELQAPSQAILYHMNKRNIIYLMCVLRITRLVLSSFTQAKYKDILA